MANAGWRKLKEIQRKKIVTHHILYELGGLTHKQEAVTVNLFGTEHYLATLLQRRGRYVSQGFLKLLEHFIWLHKDNAEDLSVKYDDTIEKPKSVGGIDG